MPLNPGTDLGSFEISGLLGVGGMGEVYRARDTKLGREVAIKVLPQAFAKDESRLARFEREAKLLAALDHHNIGAIHDFQESDGVSYLPTLLDARQPEHEFLYWEFYERGGKQAVRWDRWKGIRLNALKAPGGPIALYDLNDDLGESEDLAATHREIVRRIEGMMKSAHVDAGRYSFENRPEDN